MRDRELPPVRDHRLAVFVILPGDIGLVADHLIEHLPRTQTRILPEQVLIPQRLFTPKSRRYLQQPPHLLLGAFGHIVIYQYAHVCKLYGVSKIYVQRYNKNLTYAKFRGEKRSFFFFSGSGAVR